MVAELNRPTDGNWSQQGLNDLEMKDLKTGSLSHDVGGYEMVGSNTVTSIKCVSCTKRIRILGRINGGLLEF